MTIPLYHDECSTHEKELTLPNDIKTEQEIRLFLGNMKDTRPLISAPVLVGAKIFCDYVHKNALDYPNDLSPFEKILKVHQNLENIDLNYPGNNLESIISCVIPNYAMQPTYKKEEFSINISNAFNLEKNWTINLKHLTGYYLTCLSALYNFSAIPHASYKDMQKEEGETGDIWALKENANVGIRGEVSNNVFDKITFYGFSKNDNLLERLFTLDKKELFEAFKNISGITLENPVLAGSDNTPKITKRNSSPPSGRR